MPLIIPEVLLPLLGAPVAVLGGGVSGVAVVELIVRLGGRALLYDERVGAGQSQYFDSIAAARHNLVVFSPGFRVDHAWLRVAAEAGCVCLGELDFASLLWQGQCIAITGTNGKTTLTEFLTHALTASGEVAVSTGNVGYPFSRLVMDHDGGTESMYAVCEVSSFQAETFWHYRADAALWTNFAEDHLERHPGMQAYFAAKNELLVRTPALSVLTGSSVVRHARCLGFVLPESAALTTEGLPASPELAGTVFETYPQRENFELARAWWLLAGRPLEALHAAASTFALGRHRLSLVGEVNGVQWWNDSKATNFHAVEGALSKFKGKVILIAGGKAKGGDIAAFARRITPHLKVAVLIGETSPALAAGFLSSGLPHTACTTLEEAVRRSSEVARAGDHVLLSPGFASFDMFRGYDHRGETFEALVHALPH